MPAAPVASLGIDRLLAVVEALISRPRFLAETTASGIRGERSLPLLCLVGDSASSGLARQLHDRLRAPPTPWVPHAWVDSESAAVRSRDRWRDVNREPPLLPLLDDLHTALHADRFGPQPRFSFNLYGLADWLTGQELAPSHGRRDRRMAALLRQWAGRPERSEGPSASLSDAVAEAPSSMVRGTLHLLLAAAQRVGLHRLSQRTPGLGREARWFMRRQRYMVPVHSASFPGFAERLTVEARESENREQLKKLLVHAFLEDLRAAYRRRRYRFLPRRAGWRKTAYVTVLLDRPSEENGGWELLRLINEVRNETGAHDPLLVIATADHVPEGHAGDAAELPGPTQAAAALARWQRHLPVKRQKLGDNARYLWIGMPPATRETAADGTAPDGDVSDSGVPDADVSDADVPDGAGHPKPHAGRGSDVPGRFQPRRPPWPARRGVGESVLALVLLLTLLPLTHRVADSWGANCSYFRSGSEGVSVRVAEFGTSDDRQCIGYSDSENQIFGNNDRLQHAQRTVFAENQRAKLLHEEQPERPFLTVVHFFGLTHPNDERDTDHAAAEELEGLAMRQRENNASSSSQQPLLRVVVANAGHDMQKAPEVVRDMLVPLANRDPSVVAVLGMDRTVAATTEAITDLGLAGIPVLGTTLTGTELQDRSPLYFQMVPDNTRQAQLVADYAAYRDAQSVTVYHPNLDEADDYVETLEEETSGRLEDEDIRATSERWSPGDSLPLCADGVDRSDELLYYAGREDAFGDFLGEVDRSCSTHTKPVVVASDAVSRFMSQHERRSINSMAGLAASYVGMGSLVTLAGQSCVEDGAPASPMEDISELNSFCVGYTDLRTELGDILDKGERPSVPWPAERSGKAYDAAGILVDAVAELHHQPPGPHRGAVAQHLREQTFNGATGEIDFSSSRIGNERSLAVLEISDIHDIDEQPSCVFLIGQLNDELPRDPDSGCPT